MCGITGVWDRRGRHSPDELAATAISMANAIAHRGPDACTAWLDREAALALGHRRLSIIDLSPAGAQPMISSSNRFVISYNGEVYNADELRRELAASGLNFRGHSDTEVILEAAAAWGVEPTVTRLLGISAVTRCDPCQRAHCSLLLCLGTHRYICTE